MCLGALLFPYSPQNSALIIHLTPPLRGEEEKKITFFLSKPKSNGWRKTALPRGRGWSQPRENSSCEIRAHLAWSQRFGWKILLQSDAQITKTPLLEAAWLFPFPLTPSRYSLPRSLIHLSELSLVAASYLFLTPLAGFISEYILITDLASNPFKYPTSIHHSFPAVSIPLVLHFCTFSYFGITFNNLLISSSSARVIFLPPRVAPHIRT